MEPIWLNIFFILFSSIFAYGEETGVLGDSSETVDVTDILALENVDNFTIVQDFPENNEGSGDYETMFEMPQDIGEPVMDDNDENDR